MPCGASSENCYDLFMPTPTIQSDPAIMHGTPCFAGTRVPVRSLFDLLAHGRTVEYFLRQFPAVTAEQVATVLKTAGEQLDQKCVKAA